MIKKSSRGGLGDSGDYSSWWIESRLRHVIYGSVMDPLFSCFWTLTTQPTTIILATWPMWRSQQPCLACLHFFLFKSENSEQRDDGLILHGLSKIWSRFCYLKKHNNWIFLCFYLCPLVVWNLWQIMVWYKF